MEAALQLVSFAGRLPVPKFSRPQEYAAVHNNKEYGIYDGDIKFSSGKIVTAKNFGKAIDEYQLLDLAAKRADFKGKSFMVGALARLNINHCQAQP